MMDQQDLCGIVDVSRETLGRLRRFAELLAHWNRRINLVGPATLAALWQRHVVDSAQLWPLAPAGAGSWIDLGTGAGLPGLVIAAIAAEKAPGMTITLVESDTRKAAFLATAAREMGLAPQIEARRIEDLPVGGHDVVSARALAPLDRLCGLAVRFAHPATVFLFPKGESLDSELTAAQPRWHIRAGRIPSRTHPAAAILRITELTPRT